MSDLGLFERRRQAASDPLHIRRRSQVPEVPVPLPHNIAIVSLTREVTTRSVLQVSAALQKQVTRDFVPIWGFPATVDAFEDLTSVPNDYHHVIIFSDPRELIDLLEQQVGELPAQVLLDEFQRGSITGIHLNELTRQPFALVAASDAWTVVLSHEVLELLADPSGNHLIAAAHPFDAERRVRYLIEVCDPCQALWYPVNGVPVSDFYTPRYFDPVSVKGIRYSFTGSLQEPRQILEGGYLTFLDPLDSALYQVRFGDSQPVRVAGLDVLARSSAPLRTIVDTSPGTPQLSLATLRAAESAAAGENPYYGVNEAAEGTALRTAGALYSLAIGS